MIFTRSLDTTRHRLLPVGGKVRYRLTTCLPRGRNRPRPTLTFEPRAVGQRGRFPPDRTVGRIAEEQPGLRSESAQPFTCSGSGRRSPRRQRRGFGGWRTRQAKEKIEFIQRNRSVRLPGTLGWEDRGLRVDIMYGLWEERSRT